MQIMGDSDFLALRTEAVLRHGNRRITLSDMLSKITWRESEDGSVDIPALREDIVATVTDFVMLHRKEVDLEKLCQRIQVIERDKRVSFQLPSEVIAWTRTR